MHVLEQAVRDPQLDLVCKVKEQPTETKKQKAQYFLNPFQLWNSLPLEIIETKNSIR